MSYKIKCSTCKKTFRGSQIYQCENCGLKYCSNHIHDTGFCWSCAREKKLFTEDSIVKKCSICGKEKEIDLKAAIDYGDILCYDCARDVNELYIKYCEELIERAKDIVNG